MTSPKSNLSRMPGFEADGMIPFGWKGQSVNAKHDCVSTSGSKHDHMSSGTATFEDELSFDAWVDCKKIDFRCRHTEFKVKQHSKTDLSLEIPSEDGPRADTAIAEFCLSCQWCGSEKVSSESVRVSTPLLSCAAFLHHRPTTKSIERMSPAASTPKQCFTSDKPGKDL
jgi:hypothetical protein